MQAQKGKPIGSTRTNCQGVGEVDSNILLSEMNKIIAELKQVQIEKQSLESKTMLDNINQQNDAFSKLLDKSGDESADSSMLSKI